MKHEPPSYYTRKDLCECLRISKTSIIRYEVQGALRATKVGPHLVRYSHADVEAFLRGREGPEDEGQPPARND